MFERYLTEAFTTHFGHFVQNLDSEKVRLSAWRGELVLEDLSLRRNALDALLKECPVEIAFGKIGNLELRIPWKLLKVAWKSGNEPLDPATLGCSIVLSNVNILITPKRKQQQQQRHEDSEEEQETEKQLSLEERRIQKELDVQQLLDATLFQRVAGADEQQPHKWAEWGRALVTNLLSTLRVTIKDIHVRYEDPGTCLGFSWTDSQQRHRPPFAIGMALRQFSVQTTNRGAEDETEEMEDASATAPIPQTLRHKLVAAYQLSVFWDSEGHLMSTNVQRQPKPQLDPAVSNEETESFVDALSDTDEDTMEYDNDTMDDEEYYASAFAVLNNVGGYSFVHRKRYSREHSYLLNPVSPSLHISLVDTTTGAKEEEEESAADSAELLISPINSVEDESVNDSLPASPRGPLDTSPPLSTFCLTCPPCCFGIARSTLEDMVYVRKSLAVWKRSLKARLHESTLRRLTKLRPSLSPLVDPRSWWRYAMEATVLLSRWSRGNEVGKKRKRGWLGLAQALRQRRDYVQCYIELLSPAYKADEKEALHQSLFKMEDELLPSEIVAFRIHAYSAIERPGLDPLDDKEAPVDASVASSKWQGWLPGFKSSMDPDAPNASEQEVPVAANVPLSLEHRCRMFNEMALELEREKENKEIEEKRTSVVQVSGLESDTGEDKRSVLWKASAICTEIALEVNGHVPENDLYPSPPTRPQHHPTERTIVRLSCASIQRLSIMNDGSWELESTIASLQLEDMTPRISGIASFSNLIGPKSRVQDQPVTEKTSDLSGGDDMVYIGGLPHRHSASVFVERILHRTVKDPSDNQGNAMIVTGSTTRTRIKLSPLEVVYVTDPVAALSRVFSTMKTPELVDDYYRMASVVMDWRVRQRKRLLNALAHDRKKIFVDVNIAAPVILIPEDLHGRDCPLLVIDLGHVQFGNAPHSSIKSSSYDDKWQLELNNMQIVCSTVSSYQKEQASASFADQPGIENSDSYVSSHQLVEPFSLEFEICTKVTNSGNGDADCTWVRISATLPRLVFNLTSSAVRLVLRLQLKWAQRRAQSMATPPSSMLGTETAGVATTSYSSLSTTGSALKLDAPAGSASKHDTPGVKRSVVFHFSAPLVAFKLENDVDGRDCDQLGSITPLVDLALRDIRGTVVQEQSNNDDIGNTFDAKLRCVDAVDLYQTAGFDFALLLSSLSPEFLDSSETNVESWQSFLELNGGSASILEEENFDLVSFQYSGFRSMDNSPCANEDGELIPDKLSVSFHELYAEWNPETIAAIQKAFRLPPEEVDTASVTSHSIESTHPREDSEDQFFDAVQDDVDDDSFPDSDIHLISEISSSRSTSVSDLAPMAQPYSTTLVAPPLSPLWSPRWNTPLNRSGSGFATPSMHDYAGDQECSPRSDDEGDVPFPTPATPLEVSFHLSKLRINFNKETRHRRLLTTEMDRTNVQYLQLPLGGSKTVARIGNLTFTDPVKLDGETLYGEILGLKSESFPLSEKSEASLLEMEFEVQPRIRRFVAPHSGTDEDSPRYRTKSTTSVGVTIDPENGQIKGFDGMIQLHFSPMRFVFLQQLWMEVIDYFFEGVLGHAVWGKQHPSQAVQEDASYVSDCSFATPPLGPKSCRNLPGADADSFNFTRFNVVMDAPVLLMPVTYRSPEYIRLEFAKAEFSNLFDGRVEGDKSSERMQWYNNCAVSLHELRIVSWCGTKLTREVPSSDPNTGSCFDQPRTRDAIDVRMKVTWPMGPTATAVMPKWNVDCCFDSMTVVLRRADYALFQHIVNYNVGEVSRHLDEWKALQNLPPFELDRLKQKTVVRFGYDKKDAAPATFDVSITIPSIRCFLSEGDSAAESGACFIVEARCTDVKWYFWKHSDRISRQRIVCDVALFQPSSNLNMLRPSRINDSPGHLDVGAVFEYDEPHQVKQEGEQWHRSAAPQLTYMSTTRQSGDNVKTLEISGTCICFVYPAWMSAKGFFQSLPEPTTMTQEEVMLSVQVGDRWYQIGVSIDDQKERPGPEVDSEAQKTCVSQYQPCYQFRLVLTLPQIVLDASSISSTCVEDGDYASVVLSMSHLDYLHVNNGEGGKIRRSFFVHDLEVYTSSQESIQRESYGTENSLIHPWCVGGLLERCNEQSAGNCEEHSMQICSDVLRARAAYSDMSMAIDVFMRFIRDYRYVNNSMVAARKKVSPQYGKESGETEIDLGDQQETATAAELCSGPVKMSLDVQFDGFELLVIDDSRRHFANAQELVIFVLGQIAFAREENSRDLSDSKKRTDYKENVLGNVLDSTASACLPMSLTNLRLKSLDLLDCLQPRDSQFRLLASSRPTDSKSSLLSCKDPLRTAQDSRAISGSQQNLEDNVFSSRRMRWPEFAMADDGSWGFTVSQSMLDRIASNMNGELQERSVKNGLTGYFPGANAAGDALEDLIEVQIVHGLSHNYDANLRSLTLQWNPSTVIALQRFLGRLKKEAKTKYEKLHDEVLLRVSTPISAPPASEGENNQGEKGSFSANVVVGSLTVCLNKEHQNRRLLQATFSGSQLVLDHNNNFISVEGSVQDFNAWDPDEYSAKGFASIFDDNRKVVSVVNGKQAGSGNKNESVTQERNHFLKVRYKNFWKTDAGPNIAGNLPTWVMSHVSESETEATNIDDYLCVTIAMLQLTYIRERTEEILDYLSNGLPGKGMGATSRAAKGFIKKRIKTRSFLELSADAPQIRIPQHEGAASGVVLRLGDVRVKSWFDEGPTDSVSDSRPISSLNDDQCHISGSKEWWRVLSLSLQGIGCTTFGNSVEADPNKSAINHPLDLHLIIRKPTWRGRTVSMRGKLSFVDLTLKYSEYALLRAVGRDNIGRDIDMSRWDNVEKAYWMEEAELEASGSNDGTEVSLLETKHDVSETGRVAYASNARFIRYGRKGGSQARNRNDIIEEYRGEDDFSKSGETKAGLDFKFELDGLCLTLHRDDKMDAFDVPATHTAELVPSFNYDIVRFRVKLLVMSVSTNSAGEPSFQLSLYRLGLIDLGDIGRLARERYYKSLSDFDKLSDPRQTVRDPCAFCILAEGYSPSEKETDLQPIDHEMEDIDPQLVLTVDKVPGSSVGTIADAANNIKCSEVMVARIVINYLSVNALIRPLREIVSFVTCSWSNDGGIQLLSKENSSILSRRPSNMPPSQLGAAGTLADDGPSSTGFQLKLVAHYPRVFFVADESDPHSRALVLRGLAVLNASLMKQHISLRMNKVDGHFLKAQTICEVKNTTTIRALDAHLHSMETYINPDVDSALCLKPRHAELLHGNAQFEIPEEGWDSSATTDGDSVLGVALIQPVTVGMEYCQVQRDRFPTLRTACVNMESVSTMISFEDLSLIEAVLNRWRSSAASSMAPEGPVDLPSRGIPQEQSKTEMGASVTDSEGGASSDGFHGDHMSYHFSLDFHTGKPNGLSLERSACGNVPAITDVSPLFFHAVCGVSEDGGNSSQQYWLADERREGLSPNAKDELPLDLPIPRSGAIIVGVNGIVSADLGYEETVSLLESLCGNWPSTDFADGITSAPNDEASYSITFLEMDSSEWGRVEKMDVTIKDLSLTFIDDFQGKDMPIFRGNLTALEVHMERGLGIDTSIIHVEAPSVLTLLRSPPGAEKSIEIAAMQSSAESPTSSEMILKFNAIARTQIDYYHSRVAVWEPLVEACQLCLSFERQAGSGTRPGRLSVEFSDRILHEGGPSINSTSIGASSPESVCVNLTDAAAEVIVRAITEWKEWRKSRGVMIGDSSEKFSSTLDSPIYTRSPSLQDSEKQREVTQDWMGSVPIQKASTGDEESSSTCRLPSPNHGNAIDPNGTLVQSRPPSPNSPKSQVTPLSESRGMPPRLAAARKAAQAALLFAQKRGAETQKKGDTAEPFVFRNRTGIPAAFIQESESRKSTLKRGYRSEEGPWKRRFSTSTRRSSSLDFIELEDGQDARFHIEMTEEVSSTMLSSEGIVSDFSTSSVKRVRAYDGQLPCLTVVLKTLDGVKLDPICNLPLFKVGSSVRRLRIRRGDNKVASSTMDSGGPERTQDDYSVAVVWTVEVENNRRLLTLSSAVSIMSLGFNTIIEVGVRSMQVPERETSSPSNHVDTYDSKSAIVSVGYAKPGTPFYLPLRFAMKFEEVSVFVRPENKKCLNYSSDTCLSSRLSENVYSWGRGSVLEFVPVQTSESNVRSVNERPMSDGSQDGVSMKWVWRETFSETCTVYCDPIGFNDSVPSACMSCYASTKMSGIGGSFSTDIIRTLNTEKAGRKAKYDVQKVLIIGIDAGLSLRNMLPLSLEWEIAHKASQQSPTIILDGSSVRQQNLKEHGFVPVPYQIPLLASDEKCVLASGDCSEVFACDIALMNVHGRFRCNSQQSWSQWAPIALPSPTPNAHVCQRSSDEAPPSGAKKIPAESSKGMLEHHRPRQLNVQITDDFGVPLTIGVRMFPKLCKSSDDEGSPDVCYGIDVVVHAELWLKNLTALPLAFGCPSVQIHLHHEGELGDGDGTNDESAGKVAAEAALMEIAGVLEFGDRGVVLNNRGDDVARPQGDQYLLPYQATSVCEEVFEYIEIESSTVRRRWWASEKHDSCRQKPADFREKGIGWHWIDNYWMIDCTGQAKASEGGWESCRNLVGGKENTFSATRTFNPSHPFRRRRWFRRRACVSHETTKLPINCRGPISEAASSCVDRELLGGITAFHQPIVDSFSKAQKELERKARKNNKRKDPSFGAKGSLNISVKCGDGEWSLPAVIPDRGQAHGVFRVLLSRWPALTKTSRDPQRETAVPIAGDGQLSDYPVKTSDLPATQYKAGNLSPEVFELCYQVSDLSSDWEDFSRLMIVTPRYMLRNDSKTLTMEVKQAGAPNGTTSVLTPGEVTPFYWADIRLPELVSVRPLVDRYDNTRFYRWSGGVDICNLGMVAIRVRRSRMPHASSNVLRQQQSDHGDTFKLRSVRVLVEIRSGTGGTGINVSFKEENWKGDGSLFRVENLSPFPIWLAQDGVLANPAATLDQLRAAQRAAEVLASKSEEMKASNGLQSGADNSLSFVDDHAEVDGDLVHPMSQTCFALDVPFRQGKYAGRRAASMAELLRVRAALAPLSSREGIESTKVIGFTNVGRCFRLNPAKLTTLSEEVLSILNGVRVLGVVTTDGPTRVLRFCLMQTSMTGTVFGGAFTEGNLHRKAPYGTSSAIASQATVDAADNAVALVRSKGLLSENDAKQQAFFGAGIETQATEADDVGKSSQTGEHHQVDLLFSFRASFGAFVFSLVDSTPSEIAVLSLQSVHALAKWNSLRTSDASALISVGWLQVDNHVPNAPYPVAICPDDENREIDENDLKSGPSTTEGASSLPLLLIGLDFAPKHKSGILCLRSATISPRNLAVAVDLASIVRFLNFIDSIKKHALRSQSDAAANEILIVPSVLDGERKHSIRFPDVDDMYRKADGAGAVGVESQKLYFEGLTILPCRVSFSVAPSRALTTAQASLEGREAAAIHAAVRKGDVLIGNEGSVLGVHVGGKNRTPLAVVRGVFKSIIVDALLRCDGASMKFSGVFLRHHISSGPQLKTYLAAHYLQSLRHNVPALLGSLAAFGNPLGLIRGLGDGVSDFGSETVKGLKMSLQELDPTFAVDGVARGTESLARHAVGGFADSASLLTETFSKNMAVLTLDRRYAQRRDRGNESRGEGEFSTTFVEGIESGVAKLVRGFLEGVTGVIRAPIRGAEKRGMEGFAKGIGKGLLGLLVKPMIGISDAATDVMLGVKGSVEGGGTTLQRGTRKCQQIRPRRPVYGRDSVLRPYQLADAAASALMLRTRLAGEKYFSHCDLEDRVALLSVKRLLLLGSEGEELLMVKFKHIRSVKVRQSSVHGDGGSDWRVIIVLHAPRANGSEVEVVSCKEKAQAEELCAQIQRGVNLVASDAS